MSSTNTPAQDSGMPFKTLVRICGLGAIGVFFLPWFKGASGFTRLMELIELIQTEGAGELTKFLAYDAGQSFIGILLGGFVFLAPFIFAMFGLGMLLLGKYKGGPMSFLILFTLVGWLGFMFGGEAIGLELNFFKAADIGLWIGMGALFVPFVGMFFLDKSI